MPMKKPQNGTPVEKPIEKKVEPPQEHIKPIPKELNYDEMPVGVKMLLIIRDDVYRLFGRPQRVFTKEERAYKEGLNKFGEIVRLPKR